MELGPVPVPSALERDLSRSSRTTEGGFKREALFRETRSLEEVALAEAFASARERPSHPSSHSERHSAKPRQPRERRKGVGGVSKRFSSGRRRGLLSVVVFVLAAYVGVLIDRLEWKQLAVPADEDLTDHWPQPAKEPSAVELPPESPPLPLKKQAKLLPSRVVVSSPRAQQQQADGALKEIVSGNIQAWTEHALLCKRLKALGDVKPHVVFHSLHTDNFAGSRRRLVDILNYTLERLESEGAKGSTASEFGVYVQHAISLMGKAGSPSDQPFVATVSTISKPFSARHVARNVKMIIVKTLGLGGTSVIFEVEPVEQRVKRLLGAERLAMKVFFVRPKEGRSMKHVDESAVQRAVDSDRRTAFKLCQAYKTSDAEELWRRLHIAHPVFVGQLSTAGAPVGRPGREAVLPAVTFMPRLIGSCDLVFEYDESRPKERRPFVKDAIYVVREALKSVSQINGAGLVHCDLKLKNILIGEDGRIVVGDLNAATEPGTPVRIMTRFFLPPESRAGPVEIASFAHDAWALGLTAYFVITGELPFQGSLQSGADRRRRWSKLLNYRSPLERGHKVLFPAYKLREMKTPQVWIQIICALLEPDPSKRPTIPQVVAGFPEVFSE